jgi:predicted O-methyltransferase YrrM
MSAQPSLEGVVDDVVSSILGEDHATDWDAFEQFSELVHRLFVVPSTTITPAMRRFFYALGVALSPTSVLAVGSYVGYATIWFCGDPSWMDGARSLRCVDPDPVANRIARRNFEAIGLASWSVVDGTGLASTGDDGTDTPDLVYVDLDDPVDRKAGYAPICDALLTRPEPPATIVAHDMTAQPFLVDADILRSTLDASPAAHRSWFLPLDDSGVAVIRSGAS